MIYFRENSNDAISYHVITVSWLICAIAINSFTLRKGKEKTEDKMARVVMVTFLLLLSLIDTGKFMYIALQFIYF